LQNITGGFGFGSNQLEVQASKTLSPEQIIKEPTIDMPMIEQQAERTINDVG